ncbi:MAG: SNF2-related protein [Anaerolineae bacterium]
MSKLLALIAAENIESKVPTDFYTRGQKYDQDGRVELLKLDDDQAQLKVKGNHQPYYNVNFKFSDTHVGTTCTCPAFRSQGTCKHIVASHLYLTKMTPPQKQFNDGRPKVKLVFQNSFEKPQNDWPWRRRIDSALNRSRYSSEHSRSITNSEPYWLFFSLQKGYQGRLLKAYKVTVSQLPEAFYDGAANRPVASDSDIDEYLQGPLLTQERQTSVNSQTQLAPTKCLNLPQIAVQLISLVGQETSYSHDVHFTEYMNDIIALGGVIYLGDGRDPFQTRLKTFKEPADFSLSLDFIDDNLVTIPELKVGDSRFPVYERNEFIEHSGHVWILLGDQLFSLSDRVDSQALNIISSIGYLNMEEDEASFFVDNYLLPIMEMVSVTGNAINWRTIEDLSPQKQLYLKDDPDNKNQLIAQLAFSYGGHSMLFNEASLGEVLQRDEAEPDGLNFIRMKRDVQFEHDTLNTLSSGRSGLKKATKPHEPGIFVLRSGLETIDFLLEKIPNLTADGFEIFGEENINSVKVHRSGPSISLNVSSGIDWFDVQALVKFGDMEVKLPEIRKALRKKERFIKLADGSIGEIPSDWIARYTHLFNLGEQTEEGARFSAHHLTLIDQLLQQADQVQLDEHYEERVQKLKNFSGIKPVPLPAGFVGELRPYQKSGYDWLHFLQEFDFGGCLADDMGLGKTVQILAFLASIRENTPDLPAALIVMPRSLLTNWERETHRFTPNLKTLIYFGSDRNKNTAQFNQYDLILTTYGMMRNDIETLREYRFETIVLDESQAIKSPATQVSKAARLLKGGRRLAMSGTPVENSTFELWSQFAFLNPGLLGGLDYFKREFGNPIQKNQDEDTAKFLQEMVFPFILRRTKAQVAPDLPPRTDEIVYTDMEVDQRAFYNKTRDSYRAQLLGIVEDKGLNASRMKVLEGLLRLRQICNHPKLVDQSFRGDSAKMIYLLEHLENLATPAEDGKPHKALVFSQFVQMLKLIEPELKKRNLKYAYLDGSTRKRQEQIDAFQNDPDIPFFLISLKAGGVGLNLTAADYVVHIDPWWNPAVEMQATDRTHRIGQDKPVFVKKLITRDSIEEKILELQQRKQKLVDQLIATESSFFKELTPEDIQVLFS